MGVPLRVLVCTMLSCSLSPLAGAQSASPSGPPARPAPGAQHPLFAKLQLTSSQRDSIQRIDTEFRQAAKAVMEAAAARAAATKTRVPPDLAALRTKFYADISRVLTPEQRPVFFATRDSLLAHTARLRAGGAQTLRPAPAPAR